MVLSMARPFKHPKTGVYWFRKRVPADLRPLLRKTEEKRSLRTKDVAEARRRHAEVQAEVERSWKGLRSPVTPLTHRQATALAGLVYRKGFGPYIVDEPGPPSVWENVLRLHREARAAAKLEQWLGPTVDKLLVDQGINTDAASRARLVEAVDVALVQLVQQLYRNALGDYRPDPQADRFPEWQPPAQALVGPAATLSSLLEGWAAETKPVAKTAYTWRRTLDKLAAFVGHEDAARITADDVIRWKDAMVADGLSGKTIRDTRIAPVRTILQWAIQNRRLQGANPAAGLRVALPRGPGMRGYTDAEAQRILEAALKQSDPALRWVPWICALTGARLSEVCQLRGQDVSEAHGIWMLRITGEAGSVKNAGSERVVPVHPTLVEQGLIAFIEARGEGPLFSHIRPDRFGNRGGNGSKRIGRWVRQRVGIRDRRVAPNHAWRHWFKSYCRDHGVPRDFHDAITGHVSGHEGDRYGVHPTGALYRELSKLPNPLGSS